MDLFRYAGVQEYLSFPPVILSGAKNLPGAGKILRSAQNDKNGSHSWTMATFRRWSGVLSGGRPCRAVAEVVELGSADDARPLHLDLAIRAS